MRQLRWLWILTIVLLIAACGGEDENSDDTTQSDRLVNATITPAVNSTLTTLTPTFDSQAYIANLTITAESRSTINPNNTTGTGQTGFSTATPQTGTGGIGDPSFRPEDCPIPAGWVAYTLAQGDTLGFIATSIGTTVEIIQQNNCLASPDNIFAGTVIYLPSLPPGASLATPSPDTLLNTPDTTQNTNCPVPANWVAYTLVQGDTLSTLATATGTTIEIIQQNNCLNSADRIFAGNVIYLPTLPSSSGIPAPTAAPTLTPAQSNVISVTSTPTATDNPALSGTLPSFIQALEVRPATLRSDGAYVTAQSTIELDIGIVQEANRVRYFAGITATDPNPVQIGFINTPQIGTRFSYTFSEFDDELFFQAIAENEFGETESNIVHVVYDPAITEGTSDLTFQPFTGYDNATGIYTLQPGTTVQIIWSTPPSNATSITFYVDALGANPVAVGTDNTPQNGASVKWTIPNNLRAEVYAVATLNTGGQTTSQTTLAYSE